MSMSMSLPSIVSTTLTDDSNNWKDLPPELLELVLQKLTIDDYLKCREICSSWRHVVDHALASKGRRCPPKPQLPLLLSQSSHNVTLRSCLTLQPQQHRAVFRMSDQDYWDRPSSIRYVQSVHSGWLMSLRHRRHRKDTVPYSCHCVFTFFNPRSGAKFNIPNLTFLGSWSLYGSNRIEFAFAPGSPEFLVAILISGRGWNQRLAFCKVMHGSWTSIETLETRANKFLDIALCGDDDKLCAITRAADTVFIFCLNKDPNLIKVKRLAMLDPNQALPTLIRGNVEVNDGIRHDLDNVSPPSLAMDTTNGELLLVYHFCEKSWRNRGHKASRRTKGFRVFRMDFSSGSPRWSEIRQLGDRFLFYDRSRFRVLSAKDVDGAQEFGGGNCIFFCFANTLHVDNDDTYQNHDIGVFFLSTGQITTWLCSCCSASSTVLRDNWFIPNL